MPAMSVQPFGRWNVLRAVRIENLRSADVSDADEIKELAQRAATTVMVQLRAGMNKELVKREFDRAVRGIEEFSGLKRTFGAEGFVEYWAEQIHSSPNPPGTPSQA
jgi:hypothetical protein